MLEIATNRDNNGGVRLALSSARAGRAAANQSSGNRGGETNEVAERVADGGEEGHDELVIG